MPNVTLSIKESLMQRLDRLVEKLQGEAGDGARVSRHGLLLDLIRRGVQRLEGERATDQSAG